MSYWDYEEPVWEPSEADELFDDDYLANCADINGIGITTIIPNVFYIIDWCKISRK